MFPDAPPRRVASAMLAFAVAFGSPRLLAAQSITVVASRGFRPTAILEPHLQYWLAIDSTDGALVLRDVTINPVTIGTIRVEGIEPLAREGERRPVPDTVRFEPDGRVALALSNGPARPMIRAELVGSRLAPAVRLSLRASEWPLARVMLVTISPADLHEAYWRAVGWGVRDRVRIDDAARAAYLEDAEAGPTTVAVAFGPGVRGRLQSDAADVMVTQDVGGGSALERRRVAALVLIVEPVRDGAGNARADILLGLGTSEAEALQYAQMVAGEPAAAWGRSPLRVSTPSTDLNLLLAHVLAAARPMLDFDRIGGLPYVPVAAGGPLALSARDGWLGAIVALQGGSPEAVCGGYQVLKRAADPAAGGAQRGMVANRLSARGRILWADERDARALGDKEPFALLQAEACYHARRDAAWLAAELPGLRRIARFIQESDGDGDGLVESLSDATRSGMSPLAGDSVYRVEDPVVNAVSARALECLADLEDAAARGPGASPAGDALRAAAERIRGALRALWRPTNRWFAYHATAEGALTWDHDHLQGLDVLLFGGVSDSAMRAQMVDRLVQPGWYDAAARAFNTVPSDENWYDAGAAWRGAPWHVTDFAALHAMLAFGSAAQRQLAWDRLDAEATRIVRANYARPGQRAGDNGLAMAAAGALLDLLARGLFGVDDGPEGLEIAPHVDGIADTHTWRLDGWITGDDTLSVAYRPADRALVFRLGAPQRRRVAFRVPWFTGAGCVTARRGADTERLTPVFLRDGGAYVDLRAAFDPAEVTVSASGCGR